MGQKEFQKLEELNEGDVINANLPGLGYSGSLYMVGHAPNLFARRSDMMFFGIRDGDEEIYYLNPKQLEIVDNVLVQRQPMHTLSSLGASVERVVNGELSQSEAAETLQRLDIMVFPAEMSSHPIYKDASKTLRELM